MFSVPPWFLNPTPLVAANQLSEISYLKCIITSCWSRIVSTSRILFRGKISRFRSNECDGEKTAVDLIFISCSYASK